MIDLHSHILPKMDDGAPDLDTSVKMAQQAVADGTDIIACTPHIKPSVYENSAATIIRATQQLQLHFDGLELPLRLVVGADLHISDSMLPRLRDGTAPTIGGTRYFLFEPPHHVMPPRIKEFALEVLNEGFIPILTHPERLTWIERQYDVICEMGEAGVAMQLTAASLTGGFGKRPLYWSERMLNENRVDIIASDAHNAKRRRPGLSKARDIVTEMLGEEQAIKLVRENPATILRDERLPEKQTRQSRPERASLRAVFLKGIGIGK